MSITSFSSQMKQYQSSIPSGSSFHGLSELSSYLDLSSQSVSLSLDCKTCLFPCFTFLFLFSYFHFFCSGAFSSLFSSWSCFSDVFVKILVFPGCLPRRRFFWEKLLEMDESFLVKLILVFVVNQNLLLSYLDLET